MQSLTPAQIEKLTGLSTVSQANWRRLGLFDEFGQREEGKHTRYSPLDALVIAAARGLNELGVELDVAVKLAVRLSNQGYFDEVTGYPPVPNLYEFCFVGRQEAASKSLSAKMDYAAVGQKYFVGFMRADVPVSYVNAFSTQGGLVIPISAVRERIPQAILDLFTDEDE